MRGLRTTIIALLATAMVCLGSGTSLAAGTGALAPANPQSYQELSAKWWQWTVSMAMSDSGPFGEHGTDCSQNQPPGNTWFLAGQFTANPAERDCDIPAQTRLFFPLANSECSTLEVDTDFYGATVAGRRACLDQFPFVGLVAELDGKQIVADLEQYRVTSGNFPMVAVAGNPAAIPAGRGFAVGTGIYLLLAPLAPGHHVLHFTGYFPQWDWAPEATYHLDVA